MRLSPAVLPFHKNVLPQKTAIKKCKGFGCLHEQCDASIAMYLAWHPDCVEKSRSTVHRLRANSCPDQLHGKKMALIDNNLTTQSTFELSNLLGTQKKAREAQDLRTGEILKYAAGKG